MSSFAVHRSSFRSLAINTIAQSVSGETSVEAGAGTNDALSSNQPLDANVSSPQASEFVISSPRVSPRPGHDQSPNTKMRALFQAIVEDDEKEDPPSYDAAGQSSAVTLVPEVKEIVAVSFAVGTLPVHALRMEVQMAIRKYVTRHSDSYHCFVDPSLDSSDFGFGLATLFKKCLVVCVNDVLVTINTSSKHLTNNQSDYALLCHVLLHYTPIVAKVAASGFVRIANGQVVTGGIPVLLRTALTLANNLHPCFLSPGECVAEFPTMLKRLLNPGSPTWRQTNKLQVPVNIVKEDKEFQQRASAFVSDVHNRTSLYEKDISILQQVAESIPKISTPPSLGSP